MGRSISSLNSLGSSEVSACASGLLEFKWGHKGLTNGILAVILESILGDVVPEVLVITFIMAHIVHFFGSRGRREEALDFSLDVLNQLHRRVKG